MKNESDFKSVFKKSVKAEKGFSLSLAAPTIAGIPDLFCTLPGYLPTMLEAKWLKEVTPKFNRKINYSGLQKHFLEEINKVNENTAFGLIGFKWQGEIWACLTPWNIYQIDYLFASNHAHCLYNPKTKLFDVKTLFGHSSMSRYFSFKEMIDCRKELTVKETCVSNTA